MRMSGGGMFACLGAFGQGTGWGTESLAFAGVGTGEERYSARGAMFSGRRRLGWDALYSIHP